MMRPDYRLKVENLLHLLRWCLLSFLTALLAGSASALFLKALDFVTSLREAHIWLAAFLPLGGFLMAWMYHRYGADVEAGNNLLLDEIHDPKSVVPLRMAPLVLLGTLATHLFGGSAGREGTAVQMGGSLADQLSKPFRLKPQERKILLMSGISAGFASVFGTPLAGAIFGLEVLAIGRLRYEAILPCFLSAILANQVTLAWGIQHTDYPGVEWFHFTLSGFVSIVASGVVFGLTGRLFALTVHKLSAFSKTRISDARLRPVVGGTLVALAAWGLGTSKYLGLGIPTLTDAFFQLLPWQTFLLKFLFTVVTLGFGFKGGEVTPLFFIGAALGNALGYFLPLPFGLLTSVGFVAVFAGAANTPIACIFMAIEIFGPKVGIYAGLGCVFSYLVSGRSGIYHSQKLDHPKHFHSSME